MTSLHTRAICDECGDPATLDIDGFFLCERHEAILLDSVSSVASSPDVNATVAVPAPVLAAVAINLDPVAKATKGKAGTAGVNGPVRRSTAGTGLRVGEADAVRPATSEVMDATARRDEQPFPSFGGGLGNLEPGSITSGDRFAVTAGSGRARNRAAYPAVTGFNSCGSDGPGRASVASDAGIAGPQASIPDPETSSLVPVDSAALSNVDAPPLFLSVDPELEAAISALEAEWLAQGISLADCIVKNSTTLRVVAASDSISKSFSVAGA